MNGVMWSIVTIVGPALLIAAIVWAYWRNRNPRPDEIARAEQGARDLREELEEDEARRDAP